MWQTSPFYSLCCFFKVHLSICKSSLYLRSCVLFSVRVITFACVLVLYVWLFVYAQCPGLGYVHMQDVEAESHVCVFVCVCVLPIAAVCQRLSHPAWSHRPPPIDQTWQPESLTVFHCFLRNSSTNQTKPGLTWQADMVLKKKMQLFTSYLLDLKLERFLKYSKICHYHCHICPR